MKKFAVLLSLAAVLFPARAQQPPPWDDASQGEWQGFERVEIPSSADSTRQHAYFRKASGQRPQPLVVSLHTWSGDYTQHDPLAAEAAARNWNYIHPDFRGRNDTPEACGSHLVRSDLEDAVRYAVREGNTDPDDVHIVGVSGGGYAALIAYMTLRYPVRSIAAWAPISDLGAWYAESVGRRQKYAEDLLRATSRNGMPDTAALAARSPLRMPLPDALRRGTQLSIYEGIHDGYKGSVPITHALRMFNRLVADSCRISDDDMLRLVTARCNPSRDTLRRLYGRAVHLERRAAGVGVTIFEGGHEQLPQALALLPVRNPDTARRWRICTIGDSNGEKPGGWVNQLRLLLPRSQIFNDSRSGRTIGFDNNDQPQLNALRTIDQALHAAATHFGHKGCDALVICLGTNDAKACFEAQQPAVAANFDRLLTRIGRSRLVRRTPPLLIFVTPPPMHDQTAGPKYAGGNERLRRLVPQLSGIALRHGYRVIDAYEALQSVFGTYARDGVHMDADGQRILARRIADRIAEEVK